MCYSARGPPASPCPPHSRRNERAPLKEEKVEIQMFDRNTDEIRNAIIGANDAIASVRAKPKMAYKNDCFANEGFRATEWIEELRTFPIPTAAPAEAIVAAPAPIDFAPSNIKSRE
ncbi:hypothetical protein H6P81_021194 [Aristolochia fimbriata]|uniref:Uncharacterized protein n=1 Tax=Aristolochia fimbriata TaxID=158543 RepID=A0AAV7DTP4_ARIFI|nr:hypothetical protein H6P81_021194 [Aristolochia fimbriata]